MSRDVVPFAHPWGEALVGEVADVVVGGTPSTAIPSFWGGEIPWMASGDVHLHHIHQVVGRITEQGLRFSNAVLVEPKAVAMALAGQGKTRGTVALTHVSLCTNQSVALIKPDGQKLDVVFLYQSLIPRYEEMRSRSSGGGRAGLTKAIIEKTPIQLPAPCEQRKIARILTTVDNLIEKTEALIAKYQAMKQGMMHDLFTRGVDEHGHLRPPYEEAPELYQSVGDRFFPHRWKHCLLREYAEVIGGVTLGRKINENLTIEMPYLRVANVQDGFLDLTEIKTVAVLRSEVDRYLLQRGDVVMTEGGDFDKLGRGTVWEGQISPCLHQNHVFRVRPLSNELNSTFLSYLTGSDYGRHYFLMCAKQTTNLASINASQVKAFPLLLPSPKEQSQIVDKVAAIEGMIRNEQGRASKLRLTKSGLMQDLLTGKMRVKVDEAEEVASV